MSVDCQDPSPQNGSAVLPSGLGYGQLAFITCDEGFILSGEEIISCQAAGVWSADPVCLRGLYLFAQFIFREKC